MDQNIIRNVENRSSRRDRRIILPLVTNFNELFEEYKPYCLGMNSNSYTIAPRPWINTSHDVGHVGPFCSVELLNGRKYFEVRANDITMDALGRSMIHTGINCNVSFKLIEWSDPNIVLVLAVNNQLIADCWLACINPKSIPF